MLLSLVLPSEYALVVFVCGNEGSSDVLEALEAGGVGLLDLVEVALSLVHLSLGVISWSVAWSLFLWLVVKVPG